MCLIKKKPVITLLLIAAIFGSAAAQDAQGHKLGVNAGVEMNMNSGNHPEMSDMPALAFGIHSGGEFNLNKMFSTGINLSVSFSDIYAFEAAGLFRWYFLGGLSDSAGLLRKIFAQADLGVWIGNDSHSDNVKFLGGGSVGMRIPLGNFYIEPYARFGYTFLAGGGVTAGYLFK